MLISDSIYGNFYIEPILEELINTREMQRLKNIHQCGAGYLVNKSWNVTRYEHSVGVMILIKILGGSIEEQIAGLLHDVSHTAFSHIIDLVLDNEDEDYHETIYERIVENSDIPRILANYGYNYKDIIYNESKWRILERPSPYLCADRVDYTLRDMYRYGYISKEEVDKFIEKLCVINGEIVITAIKEAEWFVETYYKEVIDFFMLPKAVYAGDRLSKIIKIGIEKKLINLDDLLKDDDYVLNLLNESKEEDISMLIEELTNEKFGFIKDTKNYDICQKQKIRIIDPLVLVENKIYKISNISKVTKEMNQVALEKAREGVYIKIIPNKKG